MVWKYTLLGSGAESGSGRRRRGLAGGAAGGVDRARLVGTGSWELLMESFIFIHLS